MFPQSACSKISRVKIEKLLIHWLLSAFSLAVPFPSEVTWRLWDILFLEFASSRDRTGTEAMIRLSLSIIVAYEPLLDDIWRGEPGQSDMSFEERVLGLLTAPPEDMVAPVVADIIIDTAYTDERIVQFASDSAIQARRKRWWKQYSQAGENRAVLVNEWLNTTETFGKTAKHIVANLNKNNKLLSTQQPVRVPPVDSQVARLRNGLREILMQMHHSAGKLSRAVLRFREHLYNAKIALDLTLPSRMEDESNSDSNPEKMNPNEYTMCQLQGEEHLVCSLAIDTPACCCLARTK